MAHRSPARRAGTNRRRDRRWCRPPAPPSATTTPWPGRRRSRPRRRTSPAAATSCRAAHTATPAAGGGVEDAPDVFGRGRSCDRPAAGTSRAQSTREPDGGRGRARPAGPGPRRSGWRSRCRHRRGAGGRRASHERQSDAGAMPAAASLIVAPQVNPLGGRRSEPDRERCSGPELAGVEVGGRGRFARELDDLDRLGEAGQPARWRPGRGQRRPPGDRSTCSAGMSTSPGPAASHRRDARLTAEPM